MRSNHNDDSHHDSVSPVTLGGPIHGLDQEERIQGEDKPEKARGSQEGVKDTMEEDEEEQEIKVEDLEEGGRKMKVIRKPQEPTKEEVEEHSLIHVPFRSWCPHCVRGRGRNPGHS